VLYKAARDAVFAGLFGGEDNQPEGDSMARIDIRHSHGMSKDEAVERTKDMVNRFAERKPELVTSVTWASDGTSAQLSGPAFKGEFRVTESDVVVDVKLALLARPFKGKVQESLERNLKRAFEA